MRNSGRNDLCLKKTANALTKIYQTEKEYKKFWEEYVVCHVQTIMKNTTGKKLLSCGYGDSNGHEIYVEWIATPAEDEREEEANLILAYVFGPNTNLKMQRGEWGRCLEQNIDESRHNSVALT